MSLINCVGVALFYFMLQCISLQKIINKILKKLCHRRYRPKISIISQYSLHSQFSLSQFLYIVVLIHM